MNLADGEDSEKVAYIVGDAGVVLLNRAPGTAILNERMVFVGMDEAGSGALQGHALAEYFWETDHGTDIRYLLFQGMPGQENTVSVTVAPPTMNPICIPMTVTVGISAFFSAWTRSTRPLLFPLA